MLIHCAYLFKRYDVVRWRFSMFCFFTCIPIQKLRNYIFVLFLYYLLGTKFRGLTTLDIFVNTWICGFHYIRNITKVKSKVFRWVLKFVDCLTHEIHEIECPTNINDFTSRRCLFFVAFLMFRAQLVSKTSGHIRRECKNRY